VVTAAERLTLADAARMIREAVKDRSYRATPLGLEVARYYRWKKNEWGATPATLCDYEAILARLALYFADLELADFAPPVGVERLRECWDFHWGDRTPRTRAKVRSVWVDFFEWAVRERGLHGNPARALSRPKVRDTQITVFTPSFVTNVLASQAYPADWCLADLVLRYGVRRSGLVNAQRKHFDIERRLFTCFTKGGRIYEIPLVDDDFWLRLGLLDLEAQLAPDDFILYRQDTRRMRVELDDAEEILKLNGTDVGYAQITRRKHDQKPTGKIAHLWWYRCLERAGEVLKGTTAGTNMHRGRHTAATELQRDSHDLKLTQSLLGHTDIRSTARYAQLDTTDLAEAMEKLFSRGIDD
jgi:site-specific recombinase XerC